MRPGFRAILLALLSGILAAPAAGQELSPRSYWPAPKGTKIFIFGYTYQTGDVLTDPSLPITGVDSKLNTALASYFQTLKVAGRTANIIVDLPYTWGTTDGAFAGEPRDRNLAGIGDMTSTFSINLLGAPSMNPAEFQALRKKPHQIFSTSVRVLIPTGEYDAEKLYNVGANRWAIKTELGYILPMKPRWLWEFELGAWFFAENREFLGDLTREQKPVFASELHLVKRFKPGFWAALDLNYYWGGRSIVDGQELADLQRNSRIGATVVYPFVPRHALKVAYSVGFITKSGGDFDMLVLGYLYRIQ